VSDSRDMMNTAWGAIPIEQLNEERACDPKERAECFRERLQNEPETVLTPTQDVYKCPACGVILDTRRNIDE